MHKSIYFENRKLWRNWLKMNHTKEKGIWLIYYKKHTKKPSVPYNDAVEEALCYGWIDSTVRRIDEERYMQQFTPRNFKSNWSISNVKRVEKLIRQNKMTQKGMDLYQFASENNMLPDPNKVPEKSVPEIPAFFAKELEKNPDSKSGFDRLTDSKKRYYLEWIMNAKREETRQKRVDEAIKLLEWGKDLGMK